MMRPMASTPWNRPVSGELDYAWVELSWSEVRAVKGALGGTVNDLVLATLAGGLGRYLRSRKFSTAKVELRAMCPVSMRPTEQRGQLGNQVSALTAPLFVGIEDPIERFRAERGAMEALKEARAAESLHGFTRFADWIPPAMQAFAASFSVPQPLYNTVSTNVPGPQIPLYLGGRRLLAFLPLGIVSSNLGLFVSILSYERRMTFGCWWTPSRSPTSIASPSACASRTASCARRPGVAPEEAHRACPTWASGGRVRRRRRRSPRERSAVA